MWARSGAREPAKGVTMRIAAMVIRRWQRVSGDLGMATLEYAVGMLTATGLAALLMSIITSDRVRGLLLRTVEQALRPFG
jgi:hypothetical protein